MVFMPLFSNFILIYSCNLMDSASPFTSTKKQKIAKLNKAARWQFICRALPEGMKMVTYAKMALVTQGLPTFSNTTQIKPLVKEDVFYYVYGLLHSPDYRQRYGANLSKELPRIPCVKTAKDFWRFSQAGRDLANCI